MMCKTQRNWGKETSEQSFCCIWKTNPKMLVLYPKWLRRCSYVTTNELFFSKTHCLVLQQNGGLYRSKMASSSRSMTRSADTWWSFCLFHWDSCRPPGHQGSKVRCTLFSWSSVHLLVQGKCLESRQRKKVEMWLGRFVWDWLRIAMGQDNVLGLKIPGHYSFWKLLFQTRSSCHTQSTSSFMSACVSYCIHKVFGYSGENV